MEAQDQQQGTRPMRWMLRGWLAALLVLVVAWGGWATYVYVRSKGKVNPIRMLISAARSNPTSQSVQIPPPYQYFRTWELAVAEAKKQKRNIFLDLYADWCFPCKKLERETFSHPSVNKVLKKYLVVKFNIDKPEGRKLVNRFRVARFPTTLMINHNGREIERVVGFYPPKFFRPALEDALGGKDLYWLMKRRYRSQSNNLSLRLKLADRALLRRQIQEARNLYSAVLRDDPKNQKSYGARGLFGLARSQARVSKYAKALPLLNRLHRTFPSSKVRVDAYRLQLYCLYKLKRNTAYHKTYALFRKMYPGQSTKFH